MPRFSRVFSGFVLLFTVLGGVAGAQTVMAPCGSTYRSVPGQKCMLLARGLTQAGAEIAAGPLTLNIKPEERFSRMCVAYGNAAANCEPGIAKIKWSAKSGAAAPAVWSELVSLTGIGGAFVSSGCFPIPAGNFRAELDGNSDGAQSSITDTDCNGSNGVDLTITLIP